MQLPSSPAPAAAGKADDEDIRNTSYRGVVRTMKGYVPPPNWLEVFSSNASMLGVSRFDDILAECQRWQRSRKGGNPHNLTDDEILACGLFTFDLGLDGKREENFFYVFNKMLRERNPQTMQLWMPYVFHFLAALNKLPCESGIVYRGTNLCAELKALYTEQSPVHWSAFTSVTKNVRVAEAFAGPHGCVMHIRVKTARSLHLYSVLPCEAELLLHPNCEFLVEREMHEENHMHVIKLLEIVHAQKVIDVTPINTDPSKLQTVVAAAPDPQHNYEQGFKLLHGRGVPKDEPEAFRCMLLAAQAGHAAAQYSVGWCYAYGKGVERSDHDMISWYTKAAAQENPDALNALGSCHEHGRGLPKDEKLALAYFRRAADKEHPSAWCKLGGYYEKGRGGLVVNVQEMLRCYQHAAELKHPNGEFKLGVCYDTGKGVAKDPKEAFKWYMRAAEREHAQAQVNVGLCYDTGRGVARDQSAAVRYFKRAAQSGHPIAQFNVGVCYAQGDGVERDQAQAVLWYRKAAEQGHAQAQHALAACYAGGTGVVRDDAAAVTWFRKAAEQNFAAAAYSLGVCYGKGTGVTKNETEAKKWMRKAADLGHEKAKSAIKKM